jgi:hypothetical protein
MPSKKIDYSKTVIYKFVCNDLLITDIYVGSTTNFTKRKGQHKSNIDITHKKAGYKIYQTIRDNGGWDNWEMIEIEKYPCIDGNEARTRERYWYEQLNANLNMRSPITDREEYMDKNAERFKVQRKQFREDNKKRLSDTDKIKYELNKDKIKERMKKYYELNKDKIKERVRAYEQKKKLNNIIRQLGRN